MTDDDELNLILGVRETRKNSIVNLIECNIDISIYSNLEKFLETNSQLVFYYKSKEIAIFNMRSTKYMTWVLLGNDAYDFKIRVNEIRSRKWNLYSIQQACKEYLSSYIIEHFEEFEYD